MKVIAAINGTITAESMAFYALKYAQMQKMTLVLLHIENEKDDISDVELSMDRISNIALSQDIQTKRVILKGSIKEAIEKYTLNNFCDIIFCSTRQNKNYITNSFSLGLTKLNLNLDIAIVRIVKINSISNLNKVILSIDEDKLSVKKFTFFSNLALAYKAQGEIYSISSVSKTILSKVNISQIRERLNLINYNLRHYIKLSNIMNFSLNIKHEFTNNEVESIFTHLIKSNTQLVIIGAKRLSVKTFFTREMPIERLMGEASVNTIAYYPSKD